jgi:hypothetical protein
MMFDVQSLCIFTVNIKPPMKKIAFAFLALTSISSFGQNLVTVESVEYDHVSGRFFASNASNIIEVDGDGNPIQEFGTAPAADYGMEVMNDILFAIDGNRVKGFNLGDGTQLMNQSISGAVFLNGMASDGVSRIWVTDFSAKEVHEINVSDINNPVVTTIVANTVTTPNGIVYDEDNNRLVFVNWGSNAPIKAISLTDYAVTTLTSTTLGNCDGIDNDLYGNFYVSSWSPTRITRFSSNFTVNEIVTAPGLSSPADICYAEEIDTLAIANSGNATITFVGFDIASNIAEPNERSVGLSVFPNPVTESSFVEFTMSQPEFVKAQIFDMNGRLVSVLLNENLPATKHRVLLAGLALESGAYSIVVKGETFTETVQIVKSK